MIRTQVQLSDRLYGEAKRVAAEQEITLAEVIRRGLEHIVRLYPSTRSDARPWQMPQPKELGNLKVPYTEWREMTN